MIFHDSTLDELTLKMPRNKAEMMAISGIGPKRFESFGDPILLVIRQYRRMQQGGTKKSAAARTTTPSSASKARTPGRSRSLTATTTTSPVARAARFHSVDDGNTEESMIVETLTCDEIVERKFAHAKANGYVIAID